MSTPRCASSSPQLPSGLAVWPDPLQVNSLTAPMGHCALGGQYGTPRGGEKMEKYRKIEMGDEKIENMKKYIKIHGGASLGPHMGPQGGPKGAPPCILMYFFVFFFFSSPISGSWANCPMGEVNQFIRRCQKSKIMNFNNVQNP